MLIINICYFLLLCLGAGPCAGEKLNFETKKENFQKNVIQHLNININKGGKLLYYAISKNKTIVAGDIIIK